MPRASAFDPELSETSSEPMDDLESEEEDLTSEEEDIEEEEEEEDEGPPPPPKLRIKLKLPTASSNSTPTPTPQDDMDVESEDDDGDMDDSKSNTPASSRPLTSRQAVLASGGDSSLISLPSLETKPSRRKKHLTETELALRREETARKRKNMTEKRLEDEKMETINRLLKKQTRPRGKKGSTATSTPVEPSASTKPRKDKSASVDGDAEGEEGEEEAVVEEEEQVVEPPPPPSMYRWVSTSKPVEGTPEGVKVARMSFSVPLIAMGMNDSQQSGPIELPQPHICAYPGCGQNSKYRVVSNGKRACGMEHSKLLENPAAMTT